MAADCSSSLRPPRPYPLCPSLTGGIGPYNKFERFMKKVQPRAIGLYLLALRLDLCGKTPMPSYVSGRFRLPVRLVSVILYTHVRLSALHVSRENDCSP